MRNSQAKLKTPSKTRFAARQYRIRAGHYSLLAALLDSEQAMGDLTRRLRVIPRFRARRSRRIPVFYLLSSIFLAVGLVLSLAALAKKVFDRKTDGNGGTGAENQFVTKTELHHELNTVRDKIDARFLALSEKIEHLGTGIHEKLIAFESALARVDERTKR